MNGVKLRARGTTTLQTGKGLPELLMPRSLF